MTEIVSPSTFPRDDHHRGALDGTIRFVVIATMAFLTVVDLFAAQALLPTLVVRYGVSPAAMGLAVNACTFGMAAAGLAVALFSRHIDRRAGILLSLVLLTIPTALLAWAPNLAVFATLRVVQGLCMATAFSLTLAHLGEHYSAKQAAGAFAAYITGNVASNLIGRLIATGAAEHFGLAGAFYTFAALNLAGAALAYFVIPARSHGWQRPCRWTWQCAVGWSIYDTHRCAPASASAFASCLPSSAHSRSSISSSSRRPCRSA